MSRPCECDRYRPGEPFARGRDCAECWLWHENPDSPAVKIWKGEVSSAPARRPPAAAPRPLSVLPCRYEGPVLTGPERHAAGLSHARAWHHCLSPDRPLGAHACRCQGCGPGCRGYSPDAEETTPPPGTAAGPFEWVSTARLVAEAITLAGKLPADITAVAGIPRSGLLPAGVIATHLHLPLYQLTDGGLLRLGHGSRGGSLPDPARGRVAVVDDTVYGGTAMRRARAAVGRRGAVFAAVYARPAAKGAVDLYARELPSPHLLEWNLCNGGPFAGFAANPVYRGGVGLDLDGVIVHDADSGGPVGTPYLVPRARPCKLIATGRHERHRKETEALLRRIGAKWERLEMLPADQELTPGNAARHKARHYAGSGLGFFVESDPVQAAMIHDLSGLSVICPAAGKVYQ